MSFVHLHTHSHYSFLRWLGKPEHFVKRAKELGMPGLALTDSGNLYGAFEFYKYCKKEGINPIIGVEFTLSRKGRANREKDNDLYSLVLLAKNYTGYRNLIDLVTTSNLEGNVGGIPRIDFELLERYRSDLIGLSAGTLGEIPQHILTGKSEAFILERIRYYKDLFGEDDFYLEIQEHADRAGQSKINDYLREIAKKYHYKVVATNDAFYPAESDKEAQDLFFCIGDGRSLEDPDRPTLIDGNYALRSPREMEEVFAHAPEAIQSTLEINAKVHIDIPYGKTLIPVFKLDEPRSALFSAYNASIYNETIKHIDSEEWNIRDICFRGLDQRYGIHLTDDTIHEFIHKINVPRPDKKLSAMSLDELHALTRSYYTERKNTFLQTMKPEYKAIIDRLEYELTVVDLMGFNGYFNIVSDYIAFAKNNNIPVGPWRGSAAGAILAYLSGITDIDPLKYGLLFERFLNPARVSMPDIDVDFSDKGRDQVLNYVRKKYGEDHVAQICTFGTIAARAAVKDVGKVLGIPFAEMNTITKLMPNKPGIKIHECLDESVEFKKLYDTDERIRKVIDSAIRLEGSIRQLGVHACAVIIAPEPITNYCALQHPPKDTTTIISQLSQYPLEELGLLKMDFLGLRNLTIIHRCLKIIQKNHGLFIDLLKIDYEDRKVFKVFAEGDTTGVFQFESSGMRKYLRELKPTVFEDLIAMASLYRPGPLQYIPTYIARKHGREKVKYPHPSLENILRPTQGIAVYQEQIMQLVQAFAGFSLGEADILRRAIGKKKIDLLMEQKEKFIKAAVAQGNTEELAKYIFEDIIEPFAGYGFNKSHAACYAMIAYQTAFLKANYPTEFMTALMVSDEDDMERITMEIAECESRGIKILPPDVNESLKHFTYIDVHSIRFGLKAIKGLGDGPIQAIIQGRSRSETKYATILDFVKKNATEVINKKSLESLILSGSLDSFGERASLIASIPKIIALARENAHQNTTRQIGLFDMGSSASDDFRVDLEKVTPMSYEEKIKGEKDIIGYSVSGHALDGLKRYVEKRTQGKQHVLAFRRTLAERVEESDLALAHEDSGDHPAPTTAPKTPASSQSDESNLPAEEEPSTPTPQQKVRKKETRVCFVGLATNVRHVQTKAGKMMIIATCESFDFRFTTVVFPKDYEQYNKIIEVDKILLVEGFLKTNLEMGEISVAVSAVKASTITAIRNQAIEMGLFHEQDKVNLFSAEESMLAEPTSHSSQEKKESISHDSSPKPQERTFQVPPHAKKEDLLACKAYLETLPRWDQRIFLDISGRRIDTKISLESTLDFADWMAKREWGSSVSEG